MRLKALVALAAGLLIAAAGPDDAIKKETAKFQGTWTLSSAAKDGQEIGADQLADLKLVVPPDSPPGHGIFPDGRLAAKSAQGWLQGGRFRPAPGKRHHEGRSHADGQETWLRVLNLNYFES